MCRPWPCPPPPPAERVLMPARAAMPHTAPLTRRQIREAERRAEQAAIRQAAARAAASLSGSHLATIPLDGTLAPVTDRPAPPAPAPAPAEPAAVDPTPATADAPTEAVARTARETEDAEPVARIPLDGTLAPARTAEDRKSTRLNSSHVASSYAGFCLK